MSGIHLGQISTKSTNLSDEERESLKYLLECPTLISDLLCEEALVNAGLSPMEPRGHSYLDFSFPWLKNMGLRLTLILFLS